MLGVVDLATSLLLCVEHNWAVDMYVREECMIFLTCMYMFCLPKFDRVEDES